MDAAAPEPATEAPRNVTVHSVLVASPAQSPEVGAGVVVAGEAVDDTVVVVLVVVVVVVVGLVVVGGEVVDDAG